MNDSSGESVGMQGERRVRGVLNGIRKEIETQHTPSGGGELRKNTNHKRSMGKDNFQNLIETRFTQLS